jgi:hypothetical protein
VTRIRTLLTCLAAAAVFGGAAAVLGAAGTAQADPDPGPTCATWGPTVGQVPEGACAPIESVIKLEP